MFHHIISDLKESTEGLKKKALKEYEVALLMPRKKKKKAKKSAQLLFNIACWGENLLIFN